NLLRDAVFADLEIVPRQVHHGLASMIGDDHVDADQVGAPAENRGPLALVGRRLLPARWRLLLPARGRLLPTRGRLLLDSLPRAWQGLLELDAQQRQRQETGPQSPGVH